MYKRQALLQAVVDIAIRISQSSPLAIHQAKQALTAATGNDLVGGYRREIDLYRRCIQGPDRIEGIAAFIEKRAPDFGKSG